MVPPDMTERDPALEPFDALIGTWATEATHPLFDGVVPGSVTYEWLEGGQFLIQRSHNERELFPDLAPDSFEGLRRLAEAPGDWKDDLKVSYRRREEERWT
jgi:hypothetical protein